MSYQPQPGTTAYRALAHLQTLAPGAEVINAQLAEKVNVSPNTLHACMVRSIEAGLVFARQKGGHQRSPTFWSLVDHQAASHAKPEAQADAGADQSHAEPAETVSPVPVTKSPVRGTDSPVPATEVASYVSAIAERHPPDQAPATTKRGLRVAAWSTGELAIEVDGGDVIVFEKPMADQVIAFCRRIGGGA